MEKQTNTHKKALQIKAGKRLQKALDKNKISQKDFAQRMSFSKTHINNLCKGKSAITVDNAKEFSKILGVRSEWLLCEDDFATEEIKEKKRFERLDKGFKQRSERAKREREFIESMKVFLGYSVQAEEKPLFDYATDSEGNDLQIPVTDFKGDQLYETTGYTITTMSDDVPREYHCTKHEYDLFISRIIKHVETEMDFFLDDLSYQEAWKDFADPKS